MHYIKLEQFSLLNCHYAFVDTPEYLADQLFIRHEVKVRFGQEFHHPGKDYVVILCRARKKDERRFLDALNELPGKMALLGYVDYPQFCEEFQTILRAKP